LVDRLGFRLDEFVPTLWEVLPWSFLVDYFSNVSEIISAATYVNSNLAYCSKTVVTERKSSVSYIADVQEMSRRDKVNGCVALQHKPAQSTVLTTIKAVSRRPNIFPGIPNLEFEIPSSPVKWVNILALAAQFK
jgi:hypothetical protein